MEQLLNLISVETEGRQVLEVRALVQVDGAKASFIQTTQPGMNL